MAHIWIRIIAVLEIVGGVFGIGLVAWGLFFTPFNPFLLVLVPIAIGIYIRSFVAGVALWRRSPFGRKASIIVQAIQLPKIVSPAVVFIFSFGLDLWVHQLWSGGLTTLGFQLKLFAFNQLYINVPGAPIGLGVSITALVFLSMLIRYKPGETPSEYSMPPPPPAELSNSSNATPHSGMQQTRIQHASSQS
jgi:hypothetical protein